MLFNSFVFIFVFLPLTLFCYFGLNRMGHHQLAKGVLVAASLYFYAFFNVSYLYIIILSVLVNYIIAHMLTLNLNKQVTPPHYKEVSVGCWCCI